ncbi:MAG: TonB-dependent receptor plug [Gemmatimonadetes bacterium]|nr:TonB-dependent receptor plug [Gemmatimonadota bacterium]
MYTIGIRPVLAVLLSIGTVAAAAAPLAAQGSGTGRIEGQVSDSLHDRPAMGATVFISRLSPEPRTFVSVFADDAGRFRFDSLVPGRYALNFFTPTLDSLELVLPDHEVILEAGGRQRVQLGLPSPATLRAAACPGLTLPPGQGAVVGTVTDATSERPIAGASVLVVWRELSVDRSTLGVVNQERRGAVRTDSLGRYRLCGVPWGESLVVQAQDSSWFSGAVDAVVDSAATVRLLALGIDRSGREPVLAATPDVVAAPRGAPSALRTGSASIQGVVYGIGDRPLSDVQLRVTDAAGTARSDSLGRFTLSGLPAGTQTLEARRVGYVARRIPVGLRSGQTITQDVRMTRIVSLDSIRIIAQRSRYPEFERHRRSAFGRFLDESEILRRNPFRTSDILRMTPGFQVVQREAQDVIVSSRGSRSLSRRSCPMNIIIDGMQHMDIDMVHPSDIVAMEAYSSNLGVPAEYSMTSPCGAVVIWTRR